jgi:hypothetical protein
LYFSGTLKFVTGIVAEEFVVFLLGALAAAVEAVDVTLGEGLRVGGGETAGDVELEGTEGEHMHGRREAIRGSNARLRGGRHLLGDMTVSSLQGDEITESSA